MRPVTAALPTEPRPAPGKRWIAGIVLWLFAALLLPTGAYAQTFPSLSGRVVDAAHLLSPEQTQQLTDLSQQIETASSRQFVVATIPDLQGHEIEDYGYQLGRAWGIGQKSANNGIILIVAPNERKVRIEVGYGLEPIMTDALSSMIIQDDILPRFKAGDMPGGIVDGANAIAAQMKLPLAAAEQRARQLEQQAPARSSGGDGGGGALIFWIVILLFFVVPLIFRRAHGRRYGGGLAQAILWGALSGGGGRSSWGDGGSSWGGGGGGGGFSGGGGSFGGGGASGSW